MKGIRLIYSFLCLHEQAYSYKINKIVSETNNRKCNKEVVIPATEDIMEVSIFLNEERSKAYEKLRKEFNLSA